MKDVLIISHQFPPEKSGHASRIFDTASHLRSMGVNITVIAPHPTFHTGDFQKNWSIVSSNVIDGLHLVNLWTWQPGSEDPSFLSRMLNYLTFPLHAIFWAFIHRHEYQIIITSAPPLFTHLPGLFAKTVLKKPWIVDIRDLWIDASISLGFIKKGSIFEKISRSFEQVCLRDADLITGTTGELGKRLSSDEAIHKKIRILPNGVDTTLFQPVVSDKKNQIVYAGNIGYAQDLEPVILSLKIVREKIPITLAIVGDGNIVGSLRDLVKDEGLDETVRFLGVVPRESVPGIMSESLIGLAPLKKLKSLEYAVPTKVYEYMSCGIPFIGCGEGEIAHIAMESHAGIIADNTPASLADAMLSLLEDRDRIDIMGRSGRDYVQKFFERQVITAQLKDYIDMLVMSS